MLNWKIGDIALVACQGSCHDQCVPMIEECILISQASDGDWFIDIGDDGDGWYVRPECLKKTGWDGMEFKPKELERVKV